jgi:hypothetical protein
VVLALLAPASGWSQTYVGKVCLLSTVTERQTGAVSEPQRAIELAATNLGGNTYALAGALSTPDQPFVVAGTGTIVGTELYLNMTTTQTHSDGWMDTGINQTRLSLGATISGTFYEIGHDYNRPGRNFDNSRFTAGTATLSLAGCN